MDPEDTPTAPRRRSIFTSIKGLLFTLAVLALLWFALRYVLTPLVIGKNEAIPQETSSMEPRVAALETRLAALEQKPTATLDITPLEARIAALENAPKPVAMVEGAAPAPAIDRTEIDTIKSELQSLKLHNQSILQSVLLASRIDEAVSRGKPFASELATLSALRPDMDKVTEPAEAYSITGVATLTALQEQFARSITPALNQNPDKSFIQNLRSLVKIRKIGAEQKGTDDEAIIARAEAALAKGNVAGAVNEIKSLGAGASFAPWLERAEAYLSAQAVVDALRRSMAGQ